MKASVMPLVLLAVLVVGFRLLGAAYPETLPNFQPLPALFLCAVVFLKGRLRWVLPLGLWLVTDPLVSLLQGYPLVWWHHLSLLAGIGATVAIALAMRKDAGAGRFLGGTVLAAVAFYFITNFVSFLVVPIYPKTLEGFVQAQWTGPVGFGPTWVFLRNLLAANVLFTVLVLVAQRFPAFAPQAAPQQVLKK